MKRKSKLVNPLRKRIPSFSFPPLLLHPTRHWKHPLPLIFFSLLSFSFYLINIENYINREPKTAGNSQVYCYSIKKNGEKELMGTFPHTKNQFLILFHLEACTCLTALFFKLLSNTQRNKYILDRLLLKVNLKVFFLFVFFFNCKFGLNIKKLPITVEQNICCPTLDQITIDVTTYNLEWGGQAQFHLFSLDAFLPFIVMDFEN